MLIYESMRGLAAIAFGLVLAAPSPARALEWLPEFQSLTEEEEEVLEGPADLGPEYQSDVLTFTKPLTWEYHWLSSQRAIDSGIGSTGAKHFLVDSRLKVHAPLTGALDFRFTWLQEQNRERDSSHYILELAFWPWKQVGFSLYGEPHMFKRDEDTGIAVNLRPAERHEIRIFNTFVDVTRLRRNDRTDTYDTDFLPYSRGLVGRIWQAPGEDPEETKDFFEYALRQETRTRWIFPDSDFEYHYYKWFASLFGSRGLDSGWRLTARVQVDRRYEEKRPTSLASEVAYQSVLTDRLFVLGEAELGGLGPYGRWRLAPRFEVAARRWVTDAGTVTYRDVLPQVSLLLPAFGTEPRQDWWRLGYQLSWHQSSGPLDVRGPFDLEDSRVDHRLDVGYEFDYGGVASIILYATFDVDQLFSRFLWEGGAAQFRLRF